MMMNALQPQQRHSVVAPSGLYQQQHHPMVQNQWYVQQVAPQPVAQTVVRRHRPSVVSPDIRHQVMQSRQMVLNQPGQRHKQVSQKLLQQLKQHQQRHKVGQMQEEELWAQAPEASSCRTPSPLPRAWMVDYKLSLSNPELGGGAFAEVFRVQHCQSRKDYAVKVMHRPNFALRGIEKQIEAEIEAMRLAAELSRDTKEELYIVKLLDVVEEGEYVYLMLELCEHGDLLKTILAQPTQRIHEQEAVIIAKQLMSGLKTVHSLGFIHRDIKPDNLLCTSEGLLKIADFGWCCTIAEAPSCLAGTFQYMAPEVLSNLPQTVQADVWSAGVTLYQMIVGRTLLQTYLGPGATNISERDPHRATAIKQQWLVNEINSTCPPPVENRPLDLSQSCWDFLRQLLHPDPAQRITVQAALCHPWLRLAAVFEEGVTEPQEAMAEAAGEGSTPSKMRRSRPKGAWTPGTANKESIGNVPTPLQPRSYDPSRNMAYTPPVSPEMTPERTLWPSGDATKLEKDDNSAPEVSPERRTRLQMSADRLKWGGSPKDTLVERCAAAGPRKSVGQLSSPQAASSSNRRKTIASQMPVASGEHLVTSSSADRLAPTHEVPQVLLNKLQSCEDELREAREMCSSMFLDPHASDLEQLQKLPSPLRQRPGANTDNLGASCRTMQVVQQLPEDSAARHVARAPMDGETTPRCCFQRETDLLTASAPPGIGAIGTPASTKAQRRVSTTIKSPVKHLVDQPSNVRVDSLLSKVVPALPTLGNAPVAPRAAGSPTVPTWPGATSGMSVCFSPNARYAGASPLKMTQRKPARPQQTVQMQSPTTSPVITRAFVRMPQGASLYASAGPVTNHIPVWGPSGPQHKTTTNTRRRASVPQNWMQGV
eukprot:TRINITY_DN18253_c0_g1_i1.p1 TRINITY_DN18253_c0_g1~~TRINITY_DN18253_c0_g1_i1.p1  ORF type:complete len:878 (-),score=158.25 TRINITY_DN18253_c0_g1_i1:285-2918(-)